MFNKPLMKERIRAGRNYEVENILNPRLTKSSLAAHETAQKRLM